MSIESVRKRFLCFITAVLFWSWVSPSGCHSTSPVFSSPSSACHHFVLLPPSALSNIFCLNSLCGFDTAVMNVGQSFAVKMVGLSFFFLNIAGVRIQMLKRPFCVTNEKCKHLNRRGCKTYSIRFCR